MINLEELRKLNTIDPQVRVSAVSKQMIFEQ